MTNKTASNDAQPTELATHWDDRYGSTDHDKLTWYESRPAVSLELLATTGGSPEAGVLDVGAGTSHFVDYLLARGYTDLSVLDLSARALAHTRRRLGECGRHVDWRYGNVLTTVFDRQWDVWHDRALFHFMIEPDARARYLRQLQTAVAPGGHAILSVFADDGPEQCSGLPTMRYSPEQLDAEFGAGFEMLESRRHVHGTPNDGEQKFIYALFRRHQRGA